MNPSLSSDALNGLKDLVREGKKIQAIKLYRETTGAGLADAKRFIDNLDTTPEPPLPARPVARLYRVILPVTDLERAARFYGAVFETPGRRISAGRHYFSCGATILACYDPVADGDGLQGGWHPHPLQYLYFAVANLEETLRRVQGAGGQVGAGIETMPWGERMFYARDPFGNPLSFVDETTLFIGE